MQLRFSLPSRTAAPAALLPCAAYPLIATYPLLPITTYY